MSSAFAPRSRQVFITIVGNERSGKSTILQYYSGGNEFSNAAIELCESSGSFLEKDVKVGDTTVTAAIREVDMCLSNNKILSNETVRTHLQQTDAIIFVADLTNMESISGMQAMHDKVMSCIHMARTG